MTIKTPQQDKKTSKISSASQSITLWFSQNFLSHAANKKENFVITWIKILVTALKKFLDDDCLTKASSIAYTAIVSLIPTLTVALSIYSIFSKVKNQKEAFFSNITSLMLKHNININIEPVFDAINSLINNAGKIGIIGGIVMIFSATATLRSLEKALNDIWKVKKQRPIFLKVVYYWSTLTLGPIFIFAGATIAARIGEYVPVALLNFLIPFAFIWTLFFFIYLVIPNTRVPLKYAAVGSIFTGTVWVTFILLFIVYIRAFAKGTFAIYGTLVSIPLFLLLVYSSVLIVLYGAEVSYTMMHPHTYRSLKQRASAHKRIQLFSGIEILMKIYAAFENGKGPTESTRLASQVSSGTDTVDYFINLFLKEGLILRLEDGTFIPALSSQLLRLSRIIDLVHSISYTVPGGAKKTKAVKVLEKLFAQVQGSNNAIIGTTTLADLMDDTVNKRSTRK